MTTVHIIAAAVLQIGWNFAPVLVLGLVGAGRGRWFRFVVGGGDGE